MINHLHLRGVTFAKVLPLVYDESLSYYEVLCKVLHKVNEIIKYLGDLGDFATEEYVNEQIALLRKELEDKINDIYDKLDEKVDKVAFNEAINSIQATLELHRTWIDELEVKYRDLIDTIDELRADLVNYVDESIRNIKVTNPLTGKIEGLQAVLNYLGNLYRIDALTAEQYDNAQLTASAYDDKQLTAQQYDFYGKDYIL